MTNVQKVYTREFKEEAVRLAQTSGKPITQVLASWVSLTPPFTNGVKSWRSMATRRFRAVDIKLR